MYSMKSRFTTVSIKYCCSVLWNPSFLEKFEKNIFYFERFLSTNSFSIFHAARTNEIRFLLSLSLSLFWTPIRSLRHLLKLFKTFQISIFMHYYYCGSAFIIFYVYKYHKCDVLLFALILLHINTCFVYYYYALFPLLRWLLLWFRLWVCIMHDCYDQYCLYCAYAYYAY